MNLLEICFTDNFAGGGGASQGIEQAIGRAKHYREDVFHVDLTGEMDA